MKTFILAVLAAVILAAPLVAGAQTASSFVFPSVEPGMSLDQVKTQYPKMTPSKQAPAGVKGFTSPDTNDYTGLRFLFSDDKLVLLSFELKEGRAAAAVAAAKTAYGETPESEEESSYVKSAGQWTLRINGDPDDGTGDVVFLDPEKMKSLGTM